jgi:hypothetical protein
MIISRISCGLGNQMFQYAVGRAISIERGTSLKLDISNFANYNPHQGFELERIFNYKAEIAGEADVRDILGWQYSSFIRQILSRRSMAAFRRKGFIIAPHFHYWPEIYNAPRDCYLVGWWQSEKYFQKRASVIRADFTFKPSLTNRNAEIAEKIARVNAVSLHVRRGDYVSNPEFGLCPPTYYDAAIKYIAERVETPCFFIFSDDIDWVRANLKINHKCCHVDHNHGSESYNDMRLMSLCRHHIIANSSFSWWGAWLNPSTKKIVIAPKRWFKAIPENTDDVFAKGWVTL